MSQALAAQLNFYNGAGEPNDLVGWDADGLGGSVAVTGINVNVQDAFWATLHGTDGLTGIA